MIQFGIQNAVLQVRQGWQAGRQAGIRTRACLCARTRRTAPHWPPVPSCRRGPALPSGPEPTRVRACDLKQARHGTATSAMQCLSAVVVTQDSPTLHRTCLCTRLPLTACRPARPTVLQPVVRLPPCTACAAAPDCGAAPHPAAACQLPCPPHTTSLATATATATTNTNTRHNQTHTSHPAPAGRPGRALRGLVQAGGPGRVLRAAGEPLQASAPPTQGGRAGGP